MGLHRFYLGQIGLGILYIFIFPLAAVIGVIDAIVFLSMDQESFDRKYNREQLATAGGSVNQSSRQQSLSPPRNDRERRYRQRVEERNMRQRNRQQTRTQQVNRSPGRQAPVTRAPETGAAERSAGLRYFKDFEYDRAIIAFQRALEKNPRDVASHFNIACSYSCEEEADKAFYHLDRAIALGFSDFERIRAHDSLAFLRVQPGYVEFENNGYRLAPDRSAEETVLENPIREEEMVELPEISEDLLEQLQRLATLREKGLLTENEFVAQKKRLLR